jgi:hypothetical protein
METMTVSVDENLDPQNHASPSPRSPPSKKERKSFIVSPIALSPRFQNIREVQSYDKETVDELLSHLVGLINKYDSEALYWSTLYEESQKELFSLKEKQRNESKEEAEYLDPEAIPVGPRRSSKQSLEGPKTGDDTVPQRSASNRWGLSFRGVLNAVVGHQYNSVSGDSGSPINNAN